MKPTQRRWPVLFLLPLLLACAGCLTFEKQTLVLKVSVNGKTAECLLIYEGFGVHDNRLDGAKEDLHALATSGQRFYLFRHWPCKVNLTDERTEDDRNRDLKARFRKLLTIRSEGFFETADGKLGLWQTLRTTDAPALFAEIDRFLVELLAERAREVRQSGDVGGELDEATLKLWEALPKSPRKLLVWDKGELRLTIPASRHFAEWMQGEWSKGSEFKKLFQPNAFRVAVTDHGLEVTCGQAGQPALKLLFDHGESSTVKDYLRQLREYAKTLPLALKPGVTAEKLVQEFTGK